MLNLFSAHLKKQFFLNKSISVSSDKQQHIDSSNIFGEKNKKNEVFQCKLKKKKIIWEFLKNYLRTACLGLLTVKEIGLIFFIIFPIHLQKLPVISYTTTLMEPYTVPKKKIKKKSIVCSWSPHLILHFLSLITHHLQWRWQSLILAKIRKGFFANEQKASLLSSVQTKDEGRKKSTFLITSGYMERFF